MTDEYCRNAIELSSDGFASIRVHTDDAGNPVDFTYLAANHAFAMLLDLGESFPVGYRATEIHLGDPSWITQVGRAGLSGLSQHFFHDLGQPGRVFSVQVTSAERGTASIQVRDATHEAKTLRLYEGIFNLTPVLLCVIDLQGKFSMVNEEWAIVLGYDRAAMINHSLEEFLHPADIAPTKEIISMLEGDLVVSHFVNRYRHADGSYRNLEWRAQYDGKSIYGAARDITERLVKERQKQRELDLMNLLFEQTLTGMVVMMLDEPLDWDAVEDKDGMIGRIMETQHVVRTNAAFLNQYRAQSGEMIGTRAVDFFKHDPGAGKALWRSLLDEKRISAETEGVRYDGTPLWIRGDYTCLYDSKGRFVGHFGMQLDITDRKMGEVALEKSERMYRLITEHAFDVIWVFDVTRRTFTYVSPSVTRLLGYAPEEVVRNSFLSILHPDDARMVHETLRGMVKEFIRLPKREDAWTIEVRHVAKDGSIVWSDATVNFRYTDEKSIEAIGVSRDITAKKADEEKIVHLSYHDQLTGLFNRRYYEEHQHQVISDPAVLPFSMVVCDVNGLKLTNDVFGHQMGDRLLRSCASILAGSIGSDDSAYRIGGDEFILLFPRTDEEAARRKVDGIRALVDARKIGETRLSVSFGIATATGRIDSLEPLFKEAEDAMYRRKLLESSSYKHDVIKLLIGSLHEKGQYERRHSEVVSTLCYHVGKEMGFPQGEADELKLAGMLHDIGKISIDSDILDRKGPLTDHEWERMRRHPEMGFQILRSVQNFGRIADWILMHHEQPDGKGYPQGLRDEMIPLASKIIAVANAYDSMTSPSGYRESKDHDQACTELVRCSGTQFDGDVVQAFLRLPVERLLEQSDRKEEQPDGKP